MSLARCTFELEVHEAELSEESEEKKRKEKKEKKRKEKNRKEKKRKGCSSSVESQNGHVVAHGHVVALEGRACALACASLREACARFRPSFAKIICSPVSGTCLAELSKPCANLAQTLRCLAVLLHLVGGPLLKENAKHANGTQMSRWSFFAYYTFLESVHIWIEDIFVKAQTTFKPPPAVVGPNITRFGQLLRLPSKRNENPCHLGFAWEWWWVWWWWIYHGRIRKRGFMVMNLRN